MSTIPDGFIIFDDLKNEVDASYTPDQHKEYDDADSEVAALSEEMRGDH